MNRTQDLPMSIYKSKKIDGEFLDENNIKNAYMSKPEMIGSVLAFAFGWQKDNVISLLTGGLQNTKTINSRTYEWDLHAQSSMRYAAVADSPNATSTRPGYGGELVELILEQKFTVSDVLLAEDDQTKLRVMREPQLASSGGFSTFVENIAGGETSYINPELLLAGKTWFKEYSIVGEGSNKGGSDIYQTPIKLHNMLTTLRKSYSITRNAVKEVMVIKLYSPDGTQSTKLWATLAEWTAMANFYQELDRNYIYSEYNKSSTGEVRLKDENGRPIYVGAGLREQISSSNKKFYTKLSYEILDEFLLDLSYNATEMGGEVNFLALTGKMGMRQFDAAIKEHTKGNNITVTDSGTFIDGKGDSLTFTGYFKTVKFLSGVSLTVKEFPLYDDAIRNKKLHPITLKPIESYRFTILNFGTTAKGKGNIRKVELNGSGLALWHVAGSTNSSGQVSTSMKKESASGFDGYTVHMLSESGLQVEDPTSCGELIYAAC